MDLQEALKQHGLSIRQHIEEEGWGWRKNIVIDLDMVQADALQLGGVRGLRQALAEQTYRPAWGVFAFPDVEIEAPLPRLPDVLLARAGMPVAAIVASRRHPVLWPLAEQFAAHVQRAFHLTLPVYDDARLNEIPTLATHSLILFGGSHENALALQLALRHRTFFLDARTPGPGGWALTTHCGLHASGLNALQVVTGLEHRAPASELLHRLIAQRDGDVVARHMHRIAPGPEMAAHFPTWNQFTSGLPERLPQLQGQNVAAPTDIVELSHLLAQGLVSGGREKNFYNIAPVDIAIECARFYQLTADERALQLFRELLWRLTEYYLKSPGGASYPSDIDFRLGLLVMHYARLEHEAIFRDEDRLIFTCLLLACTRSVHEYARKVWPVNPRDHTRFNHPTFKALSLTYAAEYFARFGLDCVQHWRDYARAVFEDSDVWRRIKQMENARVYEPFVFEHAAAYALLTGAGLAKFDPGCFERQTDRQIAATDNFLRAVDYGDSSPTMTPAISISARLLATQGDNVYRGFDHASFARQPSYMSLPILEYPGLAMSASQRMSEAGAWELQPMDGTFLRWQEPSFPLPLAFDKLAFRTGWSDEDFYLLLEGVGGKPSHAHRDANGIVRLNHQGRHWIVSNGYGRRVGLTNVVKSYSSRETGPADHNLLVLRRAGKIVTEQPMAALLQLGAQKSGAREQGAQPHVHFATTALRNYGGVDWYRTLIVVADQYCVVLDRVHVLEDGLEQAHLEWNALGQAMHLEGSRAVRLEQQGVCMDVRYGLCGELTLCDADQSSCWAGVLNSGAYPFAKFPLKKLVFALPDLSRGQTHERLVLFSAHHGQARHELTQTRPGQVTITGTQGGTGAVHIADHDLSLQATPETCTLAWSAIPTC